MGNPYAPPGTTPPRTPAPPVDPGAEPAPAPEISAEHGPRPITPLPHERGPDAPRALPEPDPAAAQNATRRALWFGLALVVLLLTMELPFPSSLAGIAVAGVATALGIRALVAVRRARSGGLALPALLIGLGLTGWFVLQLLASALFWSETAAYQECRDRAITLTATQGCTAAYEESVQERLASITPTQPAGG